MSGYRLHIDIPLGEDEEKATHNAYLLIEELITEHGRTIPMALKLNLHEKYGVDEVYYRLGHDDDRQKSNYLDKNENGHCSNKKLKLTSPDDVI
jgi:hypothetical protein